MTAELTKYFSLALLAAFAGFIAICHLPINRTLGFDIIVLPNAVFYSKISGGKISTSD